MTNAYTKGSRDGTTTKSTTKSNEIAKQLKSMTTSPSASSALSTSSSNLKLYGFNPMDPTANSYFAEQHNHMSYYNNNNTSSQYGTQLGQPCYYYPTPESSPDVHFQLLNADMVPTVASSASISSNQSSTINVFISANTTNTNSNTNKSNKRSLDLPLSYPPYDYATSNPSIYQLQSQQQQQQQQQHQQHHQYHTHSIYSQFNEFTQPQPHSTTSTPMQNYRFNGTSNAYMFDNYNPTGAATILDNKDLSMFPLRA
jgi:hypothetical protein